MDGGRRHALRLIQEAKTQEMAADITDGVTLTS